MDKLPKEKLRIVVFDNHKMEVYMDGKKVSGIMSITFSKKSNQLATHTIEYGSSICKHEE